MPTVAMPTVVSRRRRSSGCLFNRSFSVDVRRLKLFFAVFTFPVAMLGGRGAA